MLRSLATYAIGGRRLEHLPGDPALPTVVLVHGLMHRGVMMHSLARFLNEHGYPVRIYDYKTTRDGVAAHGRAFAAYLRSLPENERLAIVTHSMGGLLVRVALCALAGLPVAERIGRIVMLAPPHAGSQLAEEVSRRFPPANLLVRPLSELSNRPDAACRALPFPQGFEIGVIAGDADRKVSVESTKLPGMTDHIVVHARHVVIMFLSETRRQILAFLETGRFIPNPNPNPAPPGGRDALR